MLKKITSALLCCAALITANANANIMVDLELQLLADVSGSVSSSEYNLQISGYQTAFRDTSVIDAIVNGQEGGIAVQYIEWSTNAAIRIDWFHIYDSTSANAFADLLSGFGSKVTGIGNNTGIGTAINYGKDLFFNNQYDAVRQVMDVSGDGTNNVGAIASTARDTALALGVDTINGITIGSSSSLDSYYTNNVIGGTNPFLISAGSFDDFTAGIQQKLVREITGGGGASVPEPASIALFGLAILGLASASRKKLQK
ncbi:DUF1194 domain-containing protein [Thalassotalea piscium]